MWFTQLLNEIRKYLESVEFNSQNVANAKKILDQISTFNFEEDQILESIFINKSTISKFKLKLYKNLNIFKNNPKYQRQKVFKSNLITSSLNCLNLKEQPKEQILIKIFDIEKKLDWINKFFQKDIKKMQFSKQFQIQLENKSLIKLMLDVINYRKINAELQIFNIIQQLILLINLIKQFIPQIRNYICTDLIKSKRQNNNSIIKLQKTKIKSKLSQSLEFYLKKNVEQQINLSNKNNRNLMKQPHIRSNFMIQQKNREIKEMKPKNFCLCGGF